MRGRERQYTSFRAVRAPRKSICLSSLCTLPPRRGSKQCCFMIFTSIPSRLHGSQCRVVLPRRPHDSELFPSPTFNNGSWCLAAKARFNIQKTEIIPIGERSYRDRMVLTYRESGTWKNYPSNVRMASQGEPVRVLGAFIGNGIDQCTVWTPTIDKISKVLDRWQKGITSAGSGQARRHGLPVGEGEYARRAWRSLLCR